MQPLDKSLRNRLERTIKDARDIAEDAARATLEQLGVGEAAPFAHLSEQDRELRRKLRVHGRQLGDSLNGGKVQTMDRLIEEVAYEHWHRMLFARFLAENNLLMYPDPYDPVAVTLEECEDLAADEGAANGWELAARFAARMLPQIFRLDSPVFQLMLSPEHQLKLEYLVADLPLEVFTASDSLGWVYQFWQAKKKDEVNASEVKIGARELPAVTQLFTEPYMVSFLLDNSLGAWWVKQCSVGSDQLSVKARNFLKTAESEEELRQFFSRPGIPLEYLRFVRLPSPVGRGVGGEGKIGGTVSVVLPQNWLFLTSYRKFREKLLKNDTWHLIARLGPQAFQTPMWDFNVQLICLSRSNSTTESGGLFGDANDGNLIRGVDVSEPRTAAEKAASLLTGEIKTIEQAKQLNNPDSRIVLEESQQSDLLAIRCKSLVGVLNGDTPRFCGRFWEVCIQAGEWEFLQSTVRESVMYGGRSGCIFWQGGAGDLRALAVELRERLHDADRRGNEAWGREGVAISQMNNPPATKPIDILPLWCLCSSPTYSDLVRTIDQKVNVTNASLVKIPFDLDHWTKVAEEKYPSGLPKPYTDDPTQWIFHGHPCGSVVWDEEKKWTAHGQLRTDDAWSNDTLAALLKSADHAGKTLETWLREKFFTGHCKLFQHRPFIWHIWDGLRDGFAALVNYHKLDAKLLEALIYTYLGDWISRQKQDIASGVDGAQERLAAAEALKKKLELILIGEAPYDIFVRWKPLEKQPIGWDPDLNDGVRLNIRPFLTVPEVGKKGAGVLRDKPNIKWTKDRGKDVESAPWYHLFKGDRINDHHLTLAEKRSARALQGDAA